MKTIRNATKIDWNDIEHADFLPLFVHVQPHQTMHYIRLRNIQYRLYAQTLSAAMDDPVRENLQRFTIHAEFKNKQANCFQVREILQQLTKSSVTFVDDLSAEANLIRNPMSTAICSSVPRPVYCDKENKLILPNSTHVPFMKRLVSELTSNQYAQYLFFQKIKHVDYNTRPDEHVVQTNDLNRELGTRKRKHVPKRERKQEPTIKAKRGVNESGTIIPESTEEMPELPVSYFGPITISDTDSQQVWDIMTCKKSEYAHDSYKGYAYKELYRLRPEGRLSDYNIFAYLKKLCEQYPQCTYVDALTVGQIRTLKYKKGDFKALINRITPARVEMVFIPVNLNNQHWILYVYHKSTPTPTLYAYDPYNYKVTSENERIVTAIKRWFNMNFEPALEDTYPLKMGKHATQKNGYDCGIFVLHTATQLAHAVHTKIIPKNPVPFTYTIQGFTISSNELRLLIANISVGNNMIRIIPEEGEGEGEEEKEEASGKAVTTDMLTDDDMLIPP
jgi:hypothetical protein